MNMEKKLNFFGAAAILVLPLFLMGFSWYGVTPMTAFTPTGYATINASTASSSAVLGSNAASAAVMAMVTNMGPGSAYINFGASNVVATVAGGYPLPVSSVSRIAIGSATYAAAITPAGSATVSVVTGY
jgi:hypothetical protein